LKAATITATTPGGDWQSASTWVGGIVPGAADNVIIPSGSTVTYSGAGSATDAAGNLKFINPVWIEISGNFVLATTTGDPVFQTPVAIYILNGGTLTDNTVASEYWLQETSHIYVYTAGTYAMSASFGSSIVLDGAYEFNPSGPPSNGDGVITGTPTTVAGPFSFNVTPTGTSSSPVPGNPPVSPPDPFPSATTVAAMGVTSSTATLKGTVNDNGASTSISFNFGTDPALTGAYTVASTPSSIGAGAGNTNVTASLTGLTYSTKYYYQVAATNSNGTTKGSILNFTTAPVVYNVSVPGNNVYSAGQTLAFSIGWTYISEAPLTVSGTPYINITIGNKTRRATLIGADASNAVVYFGYTVQPGDYAPSGVVLGSSIILNGGTINDQFGDPVGLSISGSLIPAPSTSGVVVNAPAVPLVTTGPATGVTTATANLAGAVDDSGATTATMFRYGTDPGLVGATTAAATPSSVLAGTGNTAVTASLSGLTYSTKYYYTVYGSNSAGTSTGTINNFTTAPVVYSVSVPANGTYTVGQQLIFSVGWTYISEAPMVVSTAGGTPYINVTVGNKTEKAVLDHADPANAVVYFIYTVQPGDYTASGISLGTSIILNGGAINDQFGDPVGLSISGSLQAVPPLTGVNVSAPAVPIATTGASDMILSNGATIYGAVDDSGATTAVTFKYGTSPTLAGATTVNGIINSIPAGSGNTTDSVVLTALAPATTYYYQVIGANSQGTVSGAILSFTTAADQPPVVTTTGGATTFTAIGSGSTPVIVDNGVTASDPDNTTLASATVAITGNFSPGDVLGVTLSVATGSITGSYNGSTGVLTLTGSNATIAQYNAALQNVTFTNTTASPSLANRVLSFYVNDGTLPSNTSTKTVTVVAGLTFTGGAIQTASVCENTVAFPINGLLTTSDPASGQTLTYTVVTPPANGALVGFPGTATSTGASVTPTGLGYTPTAGASGSDAFTIQVSNGSVSTQTTITMTVNALSAITPITGPATVCAGAGVTLSSGPAGGVWSSDNTAAATVDASSGLVTGQAAGSANITYTYTNGSGCPSSATYAVTVNPAPATPSAITGSGAVNNEQTGVAYSVTNVAGVTYTWSYTGTGVTINGSTNAVTIDFGPTATSGTLSVTATSNCGVVSTASTLAIAVSAPTITVSPATLSDATVGAVYTPTVSATGGVASYAFAVTAGSLPAGLSLSAAGVFSGTPTAGGSFNFTVTATDAGGFVGSQAYTLTVNAPTISITPATLPDATVASAYSQSVSASGGTSPYTYAVTSGSLPAGLTLSSAGVLCGTPTSGGSFSFTITATDASTGTGPYTGAQAYTLTVNAATIGITPTALPSAAVASAYSQSVSASGGTSPYTYAVTSGSLPAGLTLSSAGVLSGTPTSGGSFSFTITATDASTGTGPYTGAQAYTLTVNAPTIGITPTTLPSAAVASAYSQSVSASGGTSPYTYAVTSGSLPAGLTLSSAGVLSGTPTSGGSFSFTITATDASTGTGPYTGVQAYTLIVNAGTITLTPTTLPDGTVAGAYNASVSASGGTSPYTYTVTSGSLPAGLTLSSAGVLSGTPTSGGSFSFTITATDASTGTGPYTGAQAYTLTVNAPTIGITPTTLPSAAVSSAYSQSVSASGGTSPYTYTVTSGSLPAGLTLSSAGVLSGTPTSGGSFSFTITATDASTGTGPYTGAQAYTLIVNVGTIALTPTTLPAGTVDGAYNASVSASGGTSPYTYTVTSGSLPAGLTLSSAGTLSGTPTSGGSFSFTITATDASTGTGPYTGAQAYTLMVNAPTVSITPATLPDATIAAAYNQSVVASGGTSPYTYAVTSGSLPTGLTLSSGGTLSGTPTAGGTFSFTITATDASTGTGPYTGAQAYSVTVNAPTIGITPTTLPNAAVASAYNQSVSASGGTGPYTYAVTSGNLPAGLTLSAGGALTGTPTAGGSFNFTITATDASTGAGPYNGAQAYTLTVSAPVITLTSTTLPAAAVASAYSTSVSAAGGISPYSYAVTSGSLPAGLTLAADGSLSGTPTAGGTFTFTITATDASAGAGPYTGSQAYTLTVNPPASISLTPATLPAGSYGQVYAGATFTASGGSAPYGFAVTSGNLPPGLSLSTGGALSGTPTLVGDYTFTVTVTDASTGTGPYTKSVSYTVHIAPATLTITAANQSMTYGGTVPALTLTYSGFINGDNAGSLTTPPTVSTTATSATGIGQYPITVSGAVDANYTIVYVNGTLTINPANLLVTAAPVTRYYNTPNPVLTFTYSGFVNGDNASVLTSTPTITTSAVQTSPPGQYPITLSGGAAANYTLLYQDAVLTVVQSLGNLITFTPLPVKTYGDPDFDLTATASSGLPVRFVSQDASIATVTQDGSGNWVVHIVAAGQVTISAFQDGNGMYSAAPEVDQTLQINKANQTITFPALPATQTTTGTPVILAATASSGLPVTYTLSDPTLATIVGNQLEFTGAGTLTVTANQAGDNDYNAAPPVSYTITLFNGAGYVSHIGVFPNPAHGTLHIRFSSDYLITKYIIFAMNGQVVRGETDVTNNNNDLQVNIADLSPGYYLVRVVCIRNNELVYPVFKVMVY
jgi:hypothetical protein